MSWDVILLQFPPRSQHILNFRAGTTFLFPKAQRQKHPLRPHPQAEGGFQEGNDVTSFRNVTTGGAIIPPRLVTARNSSD